MVVREEVDGVVSCPGLACVQEGDGLLVKSRCFCVVRSWFLLLAAASGASRRASSSVLSLACGAWAVLSLLALRLLRPGGLLPLLLLLSPCVGASLTLGRGAYWRLSDRRMLSFPSWIFRLMALPVSHLLLWWSGWAALHSSHFTRQCLA